MQNLRTRVRFLSVNPFTDGWQDNIDDRAGLKCHPPANNLQPHRFLYQDLMLCCTVLNPLSKMRISTCDEDSSIEAFTLFLIACIDDKNMRANKMEITIQSVYFQRNFGFPQHIVQIRLLKNAIQTQNITEMYAVLNVELLSRQGNRVYIPIHFSFLSKCSG